MASAVDACPCHDCIQLDTPPEGTRRTSKASIRSSGSTEVRPCVHTRREYSAQGFQAWNSLLPRVPGTTEGPSSGSSSMTEGESQALTLPPAPSYPKPLAVLAGVLPQ
eukprot:scaffold50_cov420-Prasinococcus_capsulatus_cf.AAC.18